MDTPKYAGQFVTDASGDMSRIGITTDSPAARTPTIPVQWEGGAYPVRMQLSELRVIGRHEL